jgi:hypothetical protein
MVSSAGGTSEITARVETSGGSPLSGVPVSFSTTAGTVNPISATTDSSGLAKTTLTTTAQAEVTATAGSKTGKVSVGVAAKSGLTVTASPQTTTVGTAVTFTISAASTANLVDGRIEYGDGQSRSLGTLGTNRTDQHIYNSFGNFNVTVTAREASTGASESTGTSVSVGALQVTLTASQTTTTSGTPVTLTVGGTSTAQVREYRFFFDDGSPPRSGGAPQTVYVPSSRGNKTIRVDVIGINGEVIGTATTVISVI